MPMFTLAELEAAAELVHRTMPPTPQYAWPLLARRAGCEVWVKHENHTPTGAFKVRGGLVYIDGLVRSGQRITGVVSATRGNHGQSIAFAAKRAGLRCVIYVPHGNSKEKNAAMQAFGAELVEHGDDFDTAKIEASRAAEKQGLHFVPSFHRDLVMGVATYALELFCAVPDLARVYVPIGLGSGIAGLITARDLLGLKTEVIGVVSENAAAYALSFEAGKVVATTSAHTFADGVAVRTPDAAALELILRGAERVVRVSDGDIAAAIRAYHCDTHNLAEGAGAAPLAALLRDVAGPDRRNIQPPNVVHLQDGKKYAVILCGGNIDSDVLQAVLAGKTPSAIPGGVAL